MSDNDKLEKWLDGFARTPEGKVAGAAFILSTASAPLLVPIGVVGIPVIAVSAAFHGLRRLFQT